MARLSTSRAWEESRRVFTHDGGLLTAVALALLVLPDIVAGVVAPSTANDVSIEGRVVSLIAVFIAVIGQLAIVRLALGPSTTVGQAIGHGLRRFPAMLGALLILGLGGFLLAIPLVAVLFALGAVDMSTGKAASAWPVLLLVAAFLLLAVKFMLSVPVASAENDGPLTILKRSWRLTAGNYLVLFGLELLLLIAAIFLILAATVVGGTLANLIGGELRPYSLSALILAIFVGLAQAVFTVLASVMLARIYAQLAGGAPEASVPSTGT
jgi:hypothetical protein